MATRKVWYGLSVAMMLVCFAAFWFKGLNLAVDFTGGVTVPVTFEKPAEVDRLREALEAAGFQEPQVTTFGSSREVVIRLHPLPGLESQAIRERVEGVVKSVDASANVQPVDIVGPQVGDDLRNSSIYALGFTLLFIFLYLAFRFHTWRLSLGALLAVMHDPILVLGIMSLTQTPFDLAVVAAILAVIGYSLNDTVVVFDRIRERFEVSRRLATAVALDQAINQTLSRTIMTKVTTLIVVLALLFFGGPALHGFSEALVIGILAGTYSSIYISAAVALDFGLKAEHVFPTVKKTAADHLP
jgi:preprotein translocase subunit SecF